MKPENACFTRDMHKRLLASLEECQGDSDWFEVRAVLQDVGTLICERLKAMNINPMK